MTQSGGLFRDILLVCAGASLGACLRWLASSMLNGLCPQLPAGTLLVNLAGGYIIGLTLGLAALIPSFPAELRLLVVTGFLGSLTTFSSFSAEVVLLSQAKQNFAALRLIFLHLAGSLGLTALGLWSGTLLARIFR